MDQAEHLEAGGAVERPVQHLSRLPGGEGEMEGAVRLHPGEDPGEELRDPAELLPLRGPTAEVFGRKVDREIAEDDEILRFAPP